MAKMTKAARKKAAAKAVRTKRRKYGKDLVSPKGAAAKKRKLSKRRR